jgi:catechol 2,3-dioxygenase-like lactoylglutathione lyase family enzyme
LSNIQLILPPRIISIAFWPQLNSANRFMQAIVLASGSEYALGLRTKATCRAKSHFGDAARYNPRRFRASQSSGVCTMIRGVHAMFYSSQADELRAFFRDKLGLPFTDVGGGWLIFDVAEAEIGVHPSDEAQAHSRAGMHAISIFCDDIERTVADLKAKGVEFNNAIADQGYGLVTQFKMPGGVVADLYQPHYTKETAPRPVMRLPPELGGIAPPTKPKQTERRRKATASGKKKTATKKAATKKAAAKTAAKTAKKRKAAKKASRRTAKR